MTSHGTSVCVERPNMQKEITLEETILENCECEQTDEDVTKKEHLDLHPEEIQTEQSGPLKGCGFTWDAQWFTWDALAYQLMFGFLPSFVDILTDFTFAAHLEKSGKYVAASISYSLIFLPGIFFFLHLLFRLCYKWLSSKLMFSVLYASILGAAMITCYLLTTIYCVSLLYPALLAATSILLVKAAAVFVHSPALARAAFLVTVFEVNCETSCQMIFILITWLAGSSLQTVGLVSSVLMIGKQGAEAFLQAEHNNQMKGKVCWHKATLLLAHLPAFSLATVFRLGSLGLILGCLPTITNPLISMQFFLLFFVGYSSLLFLASSVLMKKYQLMNACTLTDLLWACTGDEFTISTLKKNYFQAPLQPYQFGEAWTRRPKRECR